MCRSLPPPQSWLALGLGAAVSRGRAEACPSCAHTWHHAILAWASTSTWKLRAQFRHTAVPGDRRPQAQRQPGLRRRRGPAHETGKARRAAAQTAAAEQAAASDEQMAKSDAKEVAVTESISKEAAEDIAEEAAETIAK